VVALCLRVWEQEGEEGGGRKIGGVFGLEVDTAAAVVVVEGKVE
jgi:hypothetical protein